MNSTDITADDVLSGIDLAGKTALVTGGYSGVGLEITRALVRAGARVVVPARRPDTARAALAGLTGVEVDAMDLGDLDSVGAFATAFLAYHSSLDIVIASAAIMACPLTRVGPGWEAHFAVNHLGHYALINLLWPALAAADSARVVALASGRDPSLRIRWDDVHFEQGYDKWAAYIQSKTANFLFAQHLDRLGNPFGIQAFSAAPGYILTPLQRHLADSEMVEAGWIDADGKPMPGLFRTPQQGAATPVWAATSPDLDPRGGEYCIDCHVTEEYPWDQAEAARLWALSAELTGIDAP
jgi:NAD(P)-dependent dehydrogenase (short-subunit alcohol dehydrogenase family)